VRVCRSTLKNPSFLLVACPYCRLPALCFCFFGPPAFCVAAQLPVFLCRHVRVARLPLAPWHPRARGGGGLSGAPLLGGFFFWGPKLFMFTPCFTFPSVIVSAGHAPARGLPPTAGLPRQPPVFRSRSTPCTCLAIHAPFAAVCCFMDRSGTFSAS